MSEEKNKWYNDFVTWQVFIWVMAGVFCLLILGVRTSMEAKADAVSAKNTAENNNQKIQTDIEWIKSSLIEIKSKLK